MFYLFPIRSSKTTAPFELIHTDVWGIALTLSILGYKYYITFINDQCCYIWVYFLHQKSEVCDKFKTFYYMRHTQFGKPIKTICSDSGGEFISSDFYSFLSEKGILPQESFTHAPQQNGIVQRKNIYIHETICSLLVASSMPQAFWCEATHIVDYLINQFSTPILQNVSPYECLHGRSPSYSHLRVFGCHCFVHLPSNERTKLSPQAVKCVFVGCNFCIFQIPHLYAFRR